mmetsp:Transcript_26730/g.45093  ORF Transcript_26730/g.45093 Transcript_26730/m.45093 type:complete len:268 (-) Transcript_26730:1823-2626(-)
MQLLFAYEKHHKCTNISTHKFIDSPDLSFTMSGVEDSAIVGQIGPVNNTHEDFEWLRLGLNRDEWMKANKLFGEVIKLNIGGTSFTTLRSTVCRFPQTMLAKMFTSDWGAQLLPRTAAGEIFLDRDGVHFRHILNFLRDPDEFVVDWFGQDTVELKKEAEFYGFGDMIRFEPPFIPAAAETIEVMHSFTHHSLTCRITQDVRGIWYGDSRALDVCRECLCAQGFGTGQPVLFEFAKNRVLVADQPRPFPDHCNGCKSLKEEAEQKVY